MGLSELRKEILLKKAKKRKKLEEFLDDLARVIQKFEEATKELQKFEEKWGKSEEIRIASAEGFLEEYSRILRRLRRPTLIERITGRKKRLLANEIISIAREKTRPIVTLGELFAIIKDELGDVSINDVKSALDILLKEGQVYSLIEQEGVIYVIFPWFINEARKLLSAMHEKKMRSVTIDDVVSELDVSPSIAEILLDELVKLGIMVREEFPRRYILVH